VPSEPWWACNDATPEGCVPGPDDMTIRVVTTLDDAAAFVDRRGCGATEETRCA
jgi:hypothetical protein